MDLKNSAITAIVLIESLVHLLKNESLSKLDQNFGSLTIDNLNKTTVVLSNGLELKKNDVIDPYSYNETLQEKMIRKAIKNHFEMEKQLLTRPTARIKPLSLFFIDDIESYRGKDGEQGSLAKFVETEIKQHVTQLLKTEKHEAYREYLEKTLKDVSQSHGGYFSQDNSEKDDKIEKEIEEILHDKETLLSLDNPRRFIFSKWTLREGWDNTLSTEQITAILNGKTVIAPPKEVQEVRNAIKAYEAFQQWQPSQEADLLQAHQVLMTGLIDEVGQYRHGGVGVMSGDRVVHMAPPANQINRLMADLLGWLNDSDVHPLIQSSVFHYEFEFIHPFADGNGRMGRLWQTLILSRWNPIFANIPVESLIYQNQKAYYEVLQASTGRTDSAPFIEFILQMILDAILSSTDTAQDSDHVTAQVNVQVSDQVQRLISAMKLEDYTLAELMQLVGLNHRATFQKNYLNPAIEADLIERTIPDKPKSPKQRYRLKS